MMNSLFAYFIGLHDDVQILTGSEFFIENKKIPCSFSHNLLECVDKSLENKNT
jgi:hypothetical protein